jgi:hypothetical protein
MGVAGGSLLETWGCSSVYLATPSGDFITASVLTVDGGEGVWGEYRPLGRPAHFDPG